jgi:hypothetical protein
MMNTEREQGRSPPVNPGEPGLDSLDARELEQILVDLMIVKYPGIERVDIERFFHALYAGAVDEVEKVEADIAEKAAQWRLAALDLDQ